MKFHVICLNFEKELRIMNSEEEIENVTLIEMERRGVKTKRQYL
jgi:hypothetical protein